MLLHKQFVSLSLIILSGALIYLVNSPLLWVLSAAVTFVLCCTINVPKLSDPSPNILIVLLLLATAYPLCISFVSDMPLVELNETRELFHEHEWIAEALAIVLLQCGTLIAVTTSNNNAIGLMSILSMHRSKARKGLVYIGVVLILITFLSNPTQLIVDGGYATEEFRDDASWFSGWPLLFIFFAAIYFVKSALSKLVDKFFIYLLIVVWLLHGNRSEILFLALIPILHYSIQFVPYFSINYKRINNKFSTNVVSFNKSRVIAAFLIMIAVIGIFQFVGLYRSSGSITGAYETLAQLKDQRGSSISTIGPSAYTLTATIGLLRTETWDYKYGSTYLDYLPRSLPSAIKTPYERKPDISEELITEANTLGGVHFAAEAYINLGVYGAILFSLICGLIFNWLCSKSYRNKVYAVFLFSSVFYSPRFVWYGTIYMYKLFIFCLLLLIAFYLIKEITKENRMISS